MNEHKNTLAVRSVSGVAKAKLAELKHYSRLTYGSLIDDAVDALWEDYLSEGHDLTLGSAGRFGPNQVPSD